MEIKGTEEKITYPNLYFTVDNFEDVRLLRNLYSMIKKSFFFRRLFMKWLCVKVRWYVWN
jgi:hypothetical protein